LTESARTKPTLGSPGFLCLMSFDRLFKTDRSRKVLGVPCDYRRVAVCEHASGYQCVTHFDCLAFLQKVDYDRRRLLGLCLSERNDSQVREESL